MLLPNCLVDGFSCERRLNSLKVRCAKDRLEKHNTFEHEKDSLKQQERTHGTTQLSSKKKKKREQSFTGQLVENMVAFWFVPTVWSDGDNKKKMHTLWF